MTSGHSAAAMIRPPPTLLQK